MGRLEEQHSMSYSYHSLMIDDVAVSDFKRLDELVQPCLLSLVVKSAKPYNIEALEQALQDGDALALEQALLVPTNPNLFMSFQNRTPLEVASMKGDVGMVSLLLKGRADTEMETWIGRTALFRAACEGQHKVVGLLCDHGADKDKAVPESAMGDDVGCTALIAASQAGHVEVVRCLCDKGALLASSSAFTIQLGSTNCGFMLICHFKTILIS